MMYLLFYLALISIVGAPKGPSPILLQAAATQQPVTSIDGQWRIRFDLSGTGEKNLVFVAKAKGSGTFLLQDTATDGKSVPEPQPAAWSKTTHDRVNFSAEVELPIGTCCREVGTLMLKGKLSSGNTISGKAIFVTSTIDEENCIGFRSTLGSFTATRIPAKD